MDTTATVQTVLTVDDNDVLRYSISRMLVDAGFQVIEARTGSEALRLAETQPDLITLDVNLPDMHGFEVCRQLKSNPSTRHIPVLHVSSTFVEPEYRVRGLQQGADAYLAEPINRPELVATIEALLRVRRSEKKAIEQAEIADSERAEIQQMNDLLERRVRMRTEEVEAKSEEIRRLNAHLMRLQDEERRKLARELHDSTGQMLALLNMNFARLAHQNEGFTDEIRQIISDSAKITSELTNHVRTVSYLLHPPLLDEAGLACALDWYIQGFSDRSHIAIELTVPDNFGRLPAEMEIAIFRIIQECLTNIHKHSGSPSASVTLSRDPRQVSIVVCDAGVKFSPGTPRPVFGTGLLGMRERARQLGGELSVTFGPTGTRTDVLIPVPAS